MISGEGCELDMPILPIECPRQARQRLSFSQGRELVFVDAALGAHPVVGDLFERRAGFDAVERIPQLLLVDPAADNAHVFGHK